MNDLLWIGILEKPVKEFYRHEHANWEITYYLQGEGVCSVGNKEIEFSPGTIICLPPWMPHKENSDTGFRNIYMGIGVFEDIDVDVLHFKDTVNKDFCKIMMMIYQESHLRRFNWQNITNSMLNTLNQYMVSWKDQDNRNSLVEEFERRLIANISTKDFNMTHQLSFIPMSPDHFRRIFKKETGKTPLEYLTRLRTNNAKKLLLNRYESIKEISNMVGYDDPYYFSRLFKKETGKSPTDWQNYAINNGGK